MNEIRGFHVRTLPLFVRRRGAAARCLFDDSRIPCSARQYEPVSLTKTGIFHSPVDVETDCVVPGPSSKTGTFRIRANFYRVDRDLRRAGNAAASGTMSLRTRTRRKVQCTTEPKKIVSSNKIHKGINKISICRVQLWKY